MEPAHSTPRSRFASTLGSVGSPARRTPGTPFSARKMLDRSSRGRNMFSHSTSDAIGTPKNIFRASMSGERPRQPFTPRASSSLRNAFSPAPSKSARTLRDSTDSLITRSSVKPLTSSELFNMTIDNPPASLDGEALMKQVPADANRHGSIYADEFLAHTCPPGLDDLGRRQWFCILDLRRLKYAANELFAKKDWRLNISNFAKEYEKSRSLIMLRYGLYEFQTVKPTDEQVRKWRSDNNIPELDKEDSPVRRTQNGASKRKAEDDMPLGTSTANRSKRRQNEPPEPLPKGKRRADDDEDENQPSKMQKTNSPSQSLSAFMKAASKSSTREPAQSKPTSTDLRVGKARNPGAFRSVLDDPKDAANALSPNTPEYFSDASRHPSMDNGDTDTDSHSDSDVEDTEGNETSEASGGVGTAAEAREGTPSQSIFDRLTKDKNGQPVRVLNSGLNSDQTKAAPSAPDSQTWNTNTTVKFAGSANSLAVNSGDEEVAKPAPFKPMFEAHNNEEAKTTTTPAASLAVPSESKAFGGVSLGKAATVTEAKAESNSESNADTTPAPAASNVFFKSIGKPMESSEDPKPALNIARSATASQPSAACPSSGPSGALGSKPSTDTPSVELLEPVPMANGQRSGGDLPPSPNGPATGSSTPFGDKPSETSDCAKISTNENKPAALMFGSGAAWNGDSKPLFGPGASTSMTSMADAPKPLFSASSVSRSDAKPLASAAPATDEKVKPSFGAALASTVDNTKRPFFSSTSDASEPPAKRAFGASSTEEKPKSSGLFGSITSPNDEPKTSLFAGATSTASNIFGRSAAAPVPTSDSASKAKPAFSFASGSAPSESSKPAFAFMGESSKPDAPIAAASSEKPVFSVGSGTYQTASVFGGEKKPAPAESSNMFDTSGSSQSTSTIFSGSGNIFGGSSQNSTSEPLAPSFSFTAGPSVANPFTSSNGASSGAGINFNFGANGNDPNNSSGPFIFGGNGSAAAPTGSFTFANSTPATPPATGGAPSFSFTGATPNGNNNNIFAPQPTGLGGPAGTSTGTSSPFNFGGASSLATTPAATTPEPTTIADEGTGSQKAAHAEKAAPKEDGEEKQAQISLTEGGPGEEDEEVMYEVRCKALKEELDAPKDGENDKDKKDKKEEKSKSAWSIKGVGPLRILKHKTTGLVRVVHRAEPRGNVVINSIPIASMPYSPKGKYCIAPFPSESGGLHKWMLMVKTADAAEALAHAINKYKKIEKPQ